MILSKQFAIATATLGAFTAAYSATYCSRTLPPVRVVAVGDSITENHSPYIIDGLNETRGVGGSSYINSTFGSYEYEVTQAGQGGAAFRLAGANYRSYPTYIAGSTIFERGVKYVRGINAIGDHYVIGLGTNDAKTGTNNVTASTEAGWRNIYFAGVNTALFGGTVTQTGEMTYMPFGATPLPAIAGTRAIPVLGYTQLPNDPHIFINKITWGDTTKADTADKVKTVSNVNTFFANFSAQAAQAVGAHSIDLFALTNGHSYLLGDYVHLTNTGASLVGKAIGNNIPALAQLPDFVPCTAVTHTLPVSSSTDFNMEMRIANLGKVSSSGYALRITLTLPAAIKVQRSSTQTITKNGIHYPLVPSYGTAGPALSCYWQGNDATGNKQTVQCEAKNNTGKHVYQTATTQVLTPAVNPILSLTQAPANPNGGSPLIVQPAFAFPSNQAIFHIKLNRQNIIPAEPNNGTMEINYGGKEFARSNNKILFTIQ